MSDAPWEDYAKPEDVESKPWEDFGKPAAPETSKLESGLRGLAQGASLGFADEITGGLESLLTDKTYEQARDESRANYAKAEKDNPLTYGAGQVGGGIASTVALPGAGVGRLAAIGAAQGFGGSDAADASGMIKDAFKGSVIGAGAGAVGKALPSAGNFLKNEADQLATVPLGQTAGGGILARGANIAHKVGAKGNELLDKLTPGGDSPVAKILGRGGRYLGAGKLQAGLDTLEHAPKVAQMAAGKASSMTDYLMRSPKFQSLAQKSPAAFNALVSKMSERTGYKPETAPIDEQEAEQRFVEGN